MIGEVLLIFSDKTIFVHVFVERVPTLDKLNSSNKLLAFCLIQVVGLKVKKKLLWNNFKLTEVSNTIQKTPISTLIQIFPILTYIYLPWLLHVSVITNLFETIWEVIGMVPSYLYICHCIFQKQEHSYLTMINPPSLEVSIDNSIPPRS